MKICLVNGSPHEKGSTYTVLKAMESIFQNHAIDTEFFWIQNKPIAECIGCYQCQVKGHCVFKDVVQDFLEVAKTCDAFIFGAPVHFASINASMSAFMDRAFYINQQAGLHYFEHKPGAAIVCARRAGTTAALDGLNKYLLYAQMPIVSSRYWNMVHAQTPNDLFKDQEGLQIIRVLAKNMIWLLKCI